MSAPLRTPEPLDLRTGQGAVEDFRGEVLRGLGSRRKRLPPKFFYDGYGSELFEEICGLPEYYLTRTELAILREHAGDLADQIGPGATLVELGSGASVKTRLLLDSLPAVEAYVPVDISRTMLLESASQLARDYAPLRIQPVWADYTGLFQPLGVAMADWPRRVLFFPGSTIGNFERAEAAAYLRGCADFVGPGGRMIVGFDLVKDVRILEAAYNDRQGVTARFNLNVLERINRELDGDFQKERFQHHAFYSLVEQRIEMHLVSREEQYVTIAGQLFHFGPEETIHTESSHKYCLVSIDALLRQTGFQRVAEWMDYQRHFCVALLEKGA